MGYVHGVAKSRTRLSETNTLSPHLYSLVYPIPDKHMSQWFKVLYCGQPPGKEAASTDKG